MYMLQLYTGKHDDIRAAPRFDNAVETGCKSAIKSELIFESVLGAGLYQFSRRLIQTSDQYPQQLRYNLQENVWKPSYFLCRVNVSLFHTQVPPDPRNCELNIFLRQKRVKFASKQTSNGFLNSILTSVIRQPTAIRFLSSAATCKAVRPLLPSGRFGLNLCLRSNCRHCRAKRGALAAKWKHPKPAVNE